MDVKLNKDSLGVLMGIIGLIGAVWGFFVWIQTGRAEYSPVVQDLQKEQVEQNHRLDRTDRDRDRFSNSINKLAEKTDQLNETMTKLTTVIELNGVMQKRADNESNKLPILPSQSLPAITTERRR